MNTTVKRLYKVWVDPILGEGEIIECQSCFHVTADGFNHALQIIAERDDYDDDSRLYIEFVDDKCIGEE